LATESGRSGVAQARELVEQLLRDGGETPYRVRSPRFWR
jgi:hypothetical protein